MPFASQSQQLFIHYTAFVALHLLHMLNSWLSQECLYHLELGVEQRLKLL